jgi:hypothetical protein
MRRNKQGRKEHGQVAERAFEGKALAGGKNSQKQRREMQKAEKGEGSRWATDCVRYRKFIGRNRKIRETWRIQNAEFALKLEW